MTEFLRRLFAYVIAVGIGIAIGKLTFISNTERDDIRPPPSKNQLLIHENTCVNDTIALLESRMKEPKVRYTMPFAVEQGQVKQGDWKEITCAAVPNTADVTLIRKLLRKPSCVESNGLSGGHGWIRHGVTIGTTGQERC